MGYNRQITWGKWLHRDRIKSEYFTMYVFSVPEPTYQYPIAVIFLSIVKGRSRIRQRFLSIEEFDSFVVLPDEYRTRLKMAFEEAGKIRDRIDKQYKQMKALEGVKGNLVDTGTGEILAEAERIVNGKNT